MSKQFEVPDTAAGRVVMPLRVEQMIAAIERQQRTMQAIEAWHRGGDVVAAIERHERMIKRLEDFRRGEAFDRLQALTESLRRYPITNR